MKQAQRQAVAVAYSMAKKKGYRAEDEGPILTRDDYYELQDQMLYMVSAWLNECSYEPHIIQPLAQHLTPAQLENLRNNINNHIWPDAEINFADEVMDLLDDYVTEDDEDDGDAESFDANGFPDRNPLNPTRPSDPLNPFERRRRRPKRPLRAEGDEEFSRRLDKVIQQKRRQHTKKRMSGRMRRRLIRENKLRMKNAEESHEYVFDEFAMKHGVVSNKMMLASIGVLIAAGQLVKTGLGIWGSAKDLKD